MQMPRTSPSPASCGRRAAVRLGRLSLWTSPMQRADKSQGKKGSEGKKQNTTLEYGASWYETSRQLGSKPVRTVREELEYRRSANLAANNGKERKDLYTDNWDGSEWKGGQFNILTLVVLLFVLVPVAGLAFAFLTYGDVWG